MLPAFAPVLFSAYASWCGWMRGYAYCIHVFVCVSVGTTCSASLLAGVMSWEELQPPHLIRLLDWAAPNREWFLSCCFSPLLFPAVMPARFPCAKCMIDVAISLNFLA